MSEWIEWNGDDRPEPEDTLVEVRLRRGDAFKNEAGEFRWRHSSPDWWSWPQNIVSYRVLEGK